MSSDISHEPLVIDDSTLKDIIVDMSFEQVVTLRKEYGPTIVADLRIRLDRARWEWVIEREWIGALKNLWFEWCRIPVQIPAEFDDDQEAE